MNATDKQLNYIALLSERTGKPVRRSDIEGLSKNEASKVIDRLLARLGEKHRTPPPAGRQGR
jgi:hypothetical protein